MTYNTSSWCQVWGGRIDSWSEHVRMVKFGGFCLPRWVPHTEKEKSWKMIGRPWETGKHVTCGT
jgi:hypothetical protein